MQKLFITLGIIGILFWGSTTLAQEDNSFIEHHEEVAGETIFPGEYVSGRIIETHESEEGYILYETQLKNGEIIMLDTWGEPVREDSRVFVERVIIDGQEQYQFVTVNRNIPIILLSLLFAASVIFFARKKGIQSLLSLILSFVLIFGVMIPLLIKGYDPITTALVVGSGILFVSIFITHGFNRQSLVSFLSSFGSILIAYILLSLIISTTSLTGLIDDHIQYLSFELDNALNLVRLVAASIIIGILGVLDDITITQVAVVRELSHTEHLTRTQIFHKALFVGKDHIASLVNTLVFAYAGAALPLLMFTTLIDIPAWIIISHEFIFVEIIRSLIGVVALVCAVPLATWLAAYPFLNAIHKDNCTLETCTHHHH